MRHLSLPGATVLLVLSLGAAACGGSGPAQTEGPLGTATPTTSQTEAPDDAAPTAGTALNACEILTPADIEAALGVTGVEDGEFKAEPTSLSPGRSECRYSGDWGGIIVSLTPEDGANLYDAARGSYDDASDITGSWDGAFNSKQNRRAFVWKGSVTAMFTMSVGGIEQYDLAEKLATAVVEKL